MIYRPVVTDAHIANALRIAQTKQNNTGDQVKYQSKAVRLVEYKVRQKQQVVEAKDIEDILDSMYPRGTWRLCETLLPSDHGEHGDHLLRFGDLLEKGSLPGSCFHVPRLFALHHNNSLKNWDFNLDAVHFYSI